MNVKHTKAEIKHILHTMKNSQKYLLNALENMEARIDDIEEGEAFIPDARVHLLSMIDHLMGDDLNVRTAKKLLMVHVGMTA